MEKEPAGPKQRFSNNKANIECLHCIFEDHEEPKEVNNRSDSDFTSLVPKPSDAIAPLLSQAGALLFEIAVNRAQLGSREQSRKRIDESGQDSRRSIADPVTIVSSSRQ